MHSKNEVELSFDARSVNEGFARMAVAAFITELNPTMDELSDVKTAVSEAVTNAIIHGYDNPEEKVHMTCRIMGREVEIIVCDRGCGAGNGTVLHHKAGTGALRDGICVHGSVYG